MFPADPEPESRFSRPTDWCPNPERWSSTDDASTELEVSAMVAGLVAASQPEIVVETGSAWGQTSEFIGGVLERNGHGRLFTLEPDPERADYTRRRCHGLPVDVLERESLDWTPPDEIGLVFFDSLFPLRVPEFRHYRPHMRDGCVVVFHDTAPGHGGGQLPDGRDLLGELRVELADVPLIHLRTPRGVTIGQVW